MRGSLSAEYALLQPDDDMRYPFHGQPDAQWTWDIHATSGD